VYFVTVPELLDQLARDARETAFRIGCDRCATTTLLILDETGYVPLDRVATSFLFQLVSERYIKGSIIITSNKSHVELGLGVRG
jgi:DNA replication protein DnaC